MSIFYPLWKTIKLIRGNQRACVVTEPLWSVPYNLFLPFLTVYMAAVGLNDIQIGIVTSFDLVMQFLWTLFSGAIVDKYGRRRTMLMFGILSWTIPCVLWAASQGYWYFMIAVLFNGMWRVTGNSFSCLIVEDGDNDQLINLYTIFNLIGLIAGFISPVIGLFIDRFTIVPVMRIVYVLAMIMMTVKFILQYFMMYESDIGRRRSEESRRSSLLAMTFQGWNTFIQSLRNTNLLLYIILMVLTTCFTIVQAAFWPLFVTTAYGVSAAMISVFPAVKAVISVIVYLTVTPHIRIHSVRKPMLAGMGSLLLGLVVLLAGQLIGAAAVGVVFFSAICEAFAFAVLSPLFESLMSISIPAKERARVNSLITGLILLVSIPIGAIAGWLSQNNRMLPVVLNSGLILLEILLVLFITKTAPIPESNENMSQ